MWRLHCIRACFIIAALVSVVCQGSVQQVVESLWSHLHDSAWYRSVYFETVHAVVCYVLLNGVYAVLYCWPATWRYRLDNIEDGKPFRGVVDVTELLLPDGWKHELTLLEKLSLLRTPTLHAVTYMGPLVLLDTFTRKKYPGVDVDIWNALPPNGCVQSERLLPVASPSAHVIAAQVVLALVFYDLFFFCVHYVLHSSTFLYNVIHRKHHFHTSLVANHTDRLHILERLVIVLGANEILKLLSAHPLTRTAFVFVFVFLLVDSHSGFDFPLNYDKLCPIMGGSKYHYHHHMGRVCNLAPFFVWNDALVRSVSSWQAGR